MNRRFGSALLPLLLMAGLVEAREACSPDGPSTEDRSAIHGFLESRYPDGNVPGASVLVSCEGKTVLTFNAGMANIEWRQPLSTSTTFRVGSISKPLTAVMVLRWVESGRLDLDRPISDYVDLLPSYMRPVTTRQLLSHTSGLPDILLTPSLLPLARDWVALRQVVGMQGKTPPRGVPGETFEYSNFNYVLLALVVETIAEMPFEDAIAKHFADLGLERTHYDTRRRILAERAQEHELSPFGELLHSENIDMSHASAAGALLSSAEDLSRWTWQLVDGELLEPQTLESAWSPQKLPDGSVTSYGLGFNLGMEHGRRMIWHSGLASGFQAAWSVYPDPGLSVVVLSNGFHLANTTETMEGVAGIVLGGS